MTQKERTLTPAEAARKARFDALCREMEAQGYRRKDLTVSILAANAAVLLMVPFAVLFLYWYISVNNGVETALTPGFWLLFPVLLVLLIVLHELLHGLTWGLFAKSRFRAVSFGFIWKYLSPYCTCGEPLRRGPYLLGAAMPTLILGFGLGTLSTLRGWPLFFFLAEILLLCGSGDFLILLRILLHPAGGGDAVYCDHPCEGGAVVFEKTETPS